MAKLEHVNLTVTDPARTAQMLCELFDWHIRWAGPSQLGGNTVHVGNDEDYLAVYTYDGKPVNTAKSSSFKGGLNHVGIVVEDLDCVEAKVVAAGFEPYNHMSYEPGRRFYFNDRDDIEFEVVSYS